MLSEKLQIGEILQFTKDLPGICPVKSGDEMIYCGSNQVRILTGQSKNWIATLSVDAPVCIIGHASHIWDYALGFGCCKNCQVGIRHKNAKELCVGLLR